MTAMVATVGIFVAKYGKSPEQNWRRYWCVLVLFAVLIGLGIIFHYIPSDADDCRVGHSADVQIYAAQALWAGVMVLAAWLAAIMAAMVAAHTAKLPTWPDRLVLALVLAGMTVRLALSAGDYSHIQSEYGTLPPGISVATLLGIWHVFATMIAAMLGGDRGRPHEAGTGRRAAPPRYWPDYVVLDLVYATVRRGRPLRPGTWLDVRASICLRGRSRMYGLDRASPVHVRQNRPCCLREPCHAMRRGGGGS